MINPGRSIQQLLSARGIRDIDPDLKENLILAFNDSLELRVGVRLSDRMSEEEIHDFGKYVDAKDDKGASSWLKIHLPEHPAVVRVEHDELLAEVGRQLEHWRGLF